MRRRRRADSFSSCPRAWAHNLVKQARHRRRPAPLAARINQTGPPKRASGKAGASGKNSFHRWPNMQISARSRWPAGVQFDLHFAMPLAGLESRRAPIGSELLISFLLLSLARCPLGRVQVIEMQMLARFLILPSQFRDAPSPPPALISARRSSVIDVRL